MRWRRFFHRAYRDAEAIRDIQVYLDMEIEDNIARGMQPDEARAAARTRFGNPTLVREEIYCMHSFRFFETLWQDALYAFRRMRNKPGFNAMLAITLALGIGANAAVFSIVEAVLLKRLAYRDPSRLNMAS